jgi:hypothetical protein
LKEPLITVLGPSDPAAREARRKHKAWVERSVTAGFVDKKEKKPAEWAGSSPTSLFLPFPNP